MATQPHVLESAPDHASDDRAYLIAMARAFGGAIIFGLPLLMTMEMWTLGFSMDRLRLALFVLAMLPVLTGLAYFAGFEENFGIVDCVLSAFSAYAVAIVAAALILLLLGLLGPGMSADEMVGKIALQAVPGSIGAMLARSQFGRRPSDGCEAERRDCYAGELFLAGTGALFLAFSVAPTEEIILIAQTITGWHAVAIVGTSLLLMHAFVYAVDFRGETELGTAAEATSEFLRLTVVAYVLTLLVCAFVLWSFGRSDGLAPLEILIEAVVLGLPGAVGAAAARLIL
ncbi:MAG: TIGR02587 family membrane protein [Geminicoccaceae bacterium]|nr:TIGR02587 family membrane protein [Geminicoccaceae bacterium]